jgi:hypothetical protein
MQLENALCKSMPMVATSDLEVLSFRDGFDSRHVGTLRCSKKRHPCDQQSCPDPARGSHASGQCSATVCSEVISMVGAFFASPNLSILIGNSLFVVRPESVNVLRCQVFSDAGRHKQSVIDL